MENTTISQLESQVRHLVACFNGLRFYPLARRPARSEQILAQLRAVGEQLARYRARVLSTQLKALPLHSPQFRATAHQLHGVHQRLVRYREHGATSTPAL